MSSGISKLLNTSQGRIILSAILGFGLASLFRASCKGKNCVIYKGAPLEDLNKVYTFNSKCYKFIPKNTKCDSSKKIVVMDG